jgi:AcrR family transcriptional regulator
MKGINMLKLGRKKPTQERSKTTVDAIYQAVAHILDKDGPVGLTTNKIAEVAGVSVGSLYQYFKNKEGIFEAILMEMIERNLKNMEKSISNLDPATIDIGSIVKIVVQTHFENISNMGKLSTYLLQHSRQLLPNEHFKKADERISHFLIQKMEEYNFEIRPKNPKHAFFVCSQAVRSVFLMSFITAAPEERQAIMDELADMLTRYLEVPKKD